MRFLAASATLTILLAICGFFGVRHMMRTPHGGDVAVVIEVQPGARLRNVLGQLGAADILSYPDLVYVQARLRRQTSVRSGTYKLAASQTPQDILSTLAEGHVMMEAITLAEGLNRWQVRDLMVARAWMTAAQFDGLCDDEHFLAHHHVPGPSCEGYLYPETYKFARGTPPKDIFATLFSAYRRQIRVAMARARGPVALDERQFATLASIVEKETGAAEERPRIACVFFNRLKAIPPWKLETDPTVIYAATLEDPHFDGNIKSYHLHKLNNPYNTYRVAGLPPGPISNPGAGALSAVAAPLACEDFFFVSKNHGRHIFCPTLGCHRQAVKTYQIDYFKRSRAARAAGLKADPPRPEIQGEMMGEGPSKPRRSRHGRSFRQNRSHKGVSAPSGRS